MHPEEFTAWHEFSAVGIFGPVFIDLMFTSIRSMTSLSLLVGYGIQKNGAWFEQADAKTHVSYSAILPSPEVF
jgi:hypothetical protein